MNFKQIMMRTFGIGGALALGGLLSCSSLLSIAQVSLPSKERTNGALVSEAFAEQREVLQRSSAVLYDGLMFFSYGMVVSEDGYILVKASELQGRDSYTVRIDKDKFEKPTVVATNPRWDVALLKVNAQGLTPVVWADAEELSQGSWIVANGATTRHFRRASAGIVSAKYRALTGLAPAVLGVSFQPKKGSLIIADVVEDTGAERSGLKVGDVLTMFDGKAVTTREGLVELVRDHIAGDSVEVEFTREGKIFKTDLELMARKEAFKQSKSRNDSMSGDVSDRRDSFPRVMQTDIRFGNSRHIGGPLLNLDGKCVGMNIARANRVESFAIPVKEVREVLAKLLKEVDTL